MSSSPPLSPMKNRDNNNTNETEDNDDDDLNPMSSTFESSSDEPVTEDSNHDNDDSNQIEIVERITKRQRRNSSSSNTNSSQSDNDDGNEEETSSIRSPGDNNTVPDNTNLFHTNPEDLVLPFSSTTTTTVLNDNDNNSIASDIHPNDTNNRNNETDDVDSIVLSDSDDNNGSDTDDDDNENEVTYIRGTDLHVRTAARAFTDFLRHFRSIQHSQEKQKQQEQQRRRQQQPRNNDHENENDEDNEINHHDSDNNDDENNSDNESTMPGDVVVAAAAPPPLFYYTQLERFVHTDPTATTVDVNVDNSSGTNSTSTTTPWTSSLDIDTMHLYYHSIECQRFYYQLIAYPMEMVPLMDLLVQKELERIVGTIQRQRRRRSRDPNGHDDDDNNNNDMMMVPPRIQVRPYNLQRVSNLRCLDPVDMDTLISLKGMIVRMSSIVPDLKVAHFACVICSNSVEVTIDRGKIQEPTGRCPICHTKSPCYQLIHNRCLYSDKQLVRIQETPDAVPAGQTPASMITFCYDDLVDSIQSGDKVEVTGVLRCQPIRVHPKITKVKAVYKTYMDVIHYRIINGMMISKSKSTNTTNNNHSNSNGTTNLQHLDIDAAANMESSGNHGVEGGWSPSRVRELRTLASDPNIYEQLTRSLAPSIWEYDDVKKGILCMLFGGNKKRVPYNNNTNNTNNNQNQNQNKKTNNSEWSDDDDEGDDNNDGNHHTPSDSTAPGGTNNTGSQKLSKRGDINILLCGDPGTSKSQLLSYVNKLSTRGIYTSGKGSSAVGLTASVVRDPETRDLVLESGALVLSDCGICCIDEFDKMSDTIRSVLHEAMEQQTVSIAKAGIIATLHARTSVLASANPVESRYNPNKSVVENIQLPPTLLSRFDLIYLILDQPNVQKDRQLAQHLVSLYYERPQNTPPPLEQDLLRDYIQYAKDHIHPMISNEAAQQLVSSYLEMRNPGGNNYNNNNGTRTITATARQLESLIRLAEALARMRYSTVVTKADTLEAVRLMNVATQSAATDPRTGRIDMDMIHTGRSTQSRIEQEQLTQLIQQQILFIHHNSNNNIARISFRDLFQQITEISTATSSNSNNNNNSNNMDSTTHSTIQPDQVVEILKGLESEGMIQFNERNQYILVKKKTSTTTTTTTPSRNHRNGGGNNNSSGARIRR